MPAPLGSFPAPHKPDWDTLLFHLPAELLLARAGLRTAEPDAHAGGSRRAGQLAALHGSRDFDDAALLPFHADPLGCVSGGALPADAGGGALPPSTRLRRPLRGCPSWGGLPPLPDWLSLWLWCGGTAPLHPWLTANRGGTPRVGGRGRRSPEEEEQ